MKPGIEVVWMGQLPRGIGQDIMLPLQGMQLASAGGAPIMGQVVT